VFFLKPLSISILDSILINWYSGCQWGRG